MKEEQEESNGVLAIKFIFGCIAVGFMIYVLTK